MLVSSAISDFADYNNEDEGIIYTSEDISKKVRQGRNISFMKYYLSSIYLSTTGACLKVPKGTLSIISVTALDFICVR